jgi:hypothetical protein
LPLGGAQLVEDGVALEHHRAVADDDARANLIGHALERLPGGLVL